MWKKSGKIVQVGTQNRSSSLYKKAKEMIQQGMVGDVHFVRAFWYRNGLPNEPSWRYVIPAEATPQNTDWNRFLGTATKRAWDPHRYFQWRLYWDNQKVGVLDPPQVGEFKDGVGEFFAQDTIDGKTILIRFRWTNLNTATPHFEQSFSNDGGTTWEVNWITDQTRVGEAPAH